MTTSADIIAHSRNPNGSEVATLDCVFPYMMLQQWNTYGAIKSSSMSMRAVPVQQLIDAVRSDPYIPEVFLSNVRGMAGGEPLPDQERIRAAWVDGIDEAIRRAETLASAGLCKEEANRPLSVYAHTRVVATASCDGWEGVIRQRTNRINPDDRAQPVFTALALKIERALSDSKIHDLAHGEWHMPYDVGTDQPPMTRIYCSGATCARTSYLTRKRAPLNIEKDAALARDRLIPDQHWSPFEHQARVDSNGDGRNLGSGWMQARALLDTP